MSFATTYLSMLNNNPQERYDKLLLSIQYFFKSTQKLLLLSWCIETLGRFNSSSKKMSYTPNLVFIISKLQNSVIL
jgi:hypothetical protein